MLKDSKICSLNFAEFNFADTGEGTIDIGSDFLYDIQNSTSNVRVQEGLYLVPSMFGRLISGHMSKRSRILTAVMTTATKPIEQLWQLDTLGIQEKDLSKGKEEQLALESFYKNVKFDENEKRFQISWPWKMYPPPIPDNFGLALGVLRAGLKKTHPKHLKTVKSILESQLESRIIEHVSDTGTTAHVHYLPYHFVVNEQKSTAVRIVYNGSAKKKKFDLSLNDCLFKGVHLVTNLLEVILGFRMSCFAIVADVKKTFHQIELSPDERDFLQFLWIDPETGKIITFRFCRVLFGIISSPFILAAIIRFMLQNKDPELAERII